MSVSAQPVASDDVRAFSARIGADPLLVQGAGGNVSWKAGDTMWVKASGTWLADARAQDLFVPVDLAELRGAIAREAYDVAPRVVHGSTLRPSIETMLHALLPHPVVAHVHAIDVLARLVRRDARAAIGERMLDDVAWTIVAYHKPGAPLAQAISAALKACPSADVVFLQNHGIVLGGESVAAVERLLERLLGRFAADAIVPPVAHAAVTSRPDLAALGYEPSSSSRCHQLAVHPRHRALLRDAWALYPDHVVFLGPSAVVVDDAVSPAAAERIRALAPPYLFVDSCGVYASARAGRAHDAQLLCYLDVLERLPPDVPLVTLDDEQIRELLDWDAEKFRQSTAK